MRGEPWPPMKWPHHRNLRNRPPTPSKGRGPVQLRIRRAFIASGAEALSSTQIYDWTHSRRRQSRRKKLPFGVYWRTLKTLRAMCDPVERVPPHVAWLWRLRNSGTIKYCVKNPHENDFVIATKPRCAIGDRRENGRQCNRLRGRVANICSFSDRPCDLATAADGLK
jgi:hypothetical protein